MKKYNLYIDFDGVIIDSIAPMVKELQEKNISKEHEKEFFTNYPWETLLKDEYLINNAIEDIHEILKSKKFNLAILTHVNSLNEAVLKIKYLRRFFKDITIIPCPKEVSKTKMVQTENSILIDDYAGNLREWEKEDGIPVRFSRKGSSKGFKVIKELKEIIDLF